MSGQCFSSLLPSSSTCVMGTAGVRAVWWCVRTCRCPCHQRRFWWGTPDLLLHQHRSHGGRGQCDTVQRVGFCRGTYPQGGPGWEPSPLGASVPRWAPQPTSSCVPRRWNVGHILESTSTPGQVGGWAGGGGGSQQESPLAFWSRVEAGEFTQHLGTGSLCGGLARLEDGSHY